MRDSVYFWDDPDELEKPKKTMALEYSVPLRRDFMAQLILPCDLTVNEAERIAAMLRTLPLAGGIK